MGNKQKPFTGSRKKHLKIGKYLSERRRLAKQIRLSQNVATKTIVEGTSGETSNNVLELDIFQHTEEMDSKPKRGLEYSLTLASPSKKQKFLDALSSDASDVNIPLAYVEVPPISYSKDCSWDFEPEDTSHDSSIKHVSLQQNVARKNAMVYTTRLDDMVVMSCRLRMDNPIAFFEAVNNESKPQINNFIRKTPYDKEYNNPLSFLKMKYRIDRINRCVTHNIEGVRRRRNKEIRNLISDLKAKPSGKKIAIKFEDLNSNVMNANNCQLNQNKDEKEGQYVINKSKLDMRRLTFRYNNYIFKNTMTKESDIYFFNSRGLITRHFRIKNDLQNYVKRTLLTVELINCCWRHRKEFVNMMTPYIPSSAAKYLSETHGCVGQCTCCCVNKTKKLEESEDPLAESLNNSTEATTQVDDVINGGRYDPPVTINELLENVKNTKRTISALIPKAIAYTPQDKQRCTDNEVKPLNYYNVTEILLHYENGNEYYRIGVEGFIVQHLSNVSHTFIENQVVGDNIINEKVCCWVACNKLADTFKKHNILLKTWKYIKTRHRPIDKSKCCCKPIKTSTRVINTHLKQLKLPAISYCTSEVSNKIQPIQFIFAQHKPLIEDDLFTIIDNSSNDDQIVQTTNNSVPSPKDSLPYKPPQYIGDNVNEVNNDMRHYVEQRRRLICSKTKYLLEKTLNKLNNITIIISENAQISATLNIPVNKLSTEELRTLSKILNEAQKEVDSLKMLVPCSQTSKKLKTYVKNCTLNFKTVNHFRNEDCNKHEKVNLYSSFTAWSNRHTDGCIKSLRSILLKMKQKIQKNDIGNHEEYNQMLKEIKTGRGNKAATETHEGLLNKKRTRIRRKPVNKRVQARSHEVGIIDCDIEPIQTLTDDEIPDKEHQPESLEDEASNELSMLPDRESKNLNVRMSSPCEQNFSEPIEVIKLYLSDDSLDEDENPLITLSQ